MAAMSKGIEIVPPNRKSNWAWTIVENKKIAMGYASINGFGEVAFSELKANDIDNMSRHDFYKKKWSKFNKKSFEGCLKAGIFDDWSNSREQIADWRTIKIKDPCQLDLFTGEVPPAELTKSDTLVSCKKILSANGFLLVNFYRHENYKSGFEDHFSEVTSWKFKANNLTLYQNI